MRQTSGPARVGLEAQDASDLADVAATRLHLQASLEGDQLTDFCFLHMLICMRTTLDLNDEIMRAVKRYAAETGRTVSSLVESALRELLAQVARKDRPYKLRWLVVRGGAQPGVDLTDRDALLDRMEGRS